MRHACAFWTFLVAGWAASPARADTYAVTETGDSGPGSLRQALLDANAHPNDQGPDIIAFAIPGAGQKTIQLLPPQLPDVTDPVIIDGFTQAGPGIHAIVVRGTGAANVSFLVIRPSGSGSTVRGLVIGGFILGIRLRGASNCRLVGNRIGVNPEDESTLLNVANGIDLIVNNLVPATFSTNNQIGGPDPLDRNVIVLKTGAAGVRVRAGCDGNHIQGNYFGTTTDGMGPLGEVGFSGVFI